MSRSPHEERAPWQTLQGLQDDYGQPTADVVLLAGEVHLGRKPNSLRFTVKICSRVFTKLAAYEREN